MTVNVGRSVIASGNPRARSLAVAKGIGRLVQVCDHPALLTAADTGVSESAKCERLLSIFREISASGERAIVFTRFVKMGEILVRQLTEESGSSIDFFHGQLSADARQRVVDRFRDGDAPALVISLLAGGTGLTLVEANHVIHFDRWWNAAIEDQATDRVHRIGQTKVVEAHRLITIGTLEERIHELIEQRRHLASRLVTPTGDFDAANLSSGELKELVALRF